MIGAQSNFLFPTITCLLSVYMLLSHAIRGYSLRKAKLDKFDLANLGV